jgi:hypothetical protein
MVARLRSARFVLSAHFGVPNRLLMTATCSMRSLVALR